MKKSKNLDHDKNTIDVLEAIGFALTVGQVIITVLGYLRRFKKH